jgi:hypothetical protein
MYQQNYACSYRGKRLWNLFLHHTEKALKKGISSEEISKLLSGSIDNVPDDESAALFFAQHYTDTRGLPSEKAWERMLATLW